MNDLIRRFSRQLFNNVTKLLIRTLCTQNGACFKIEFNLINESYDLYRIV
jgi:hypothetical protein